MFLKPKDLEKKVTLSSKERRVLKYKLCEKQSWRCASCGKYMRIDWGYWNSAELDHRIPEPAGCAKNDAETNLQVLCHECNTAKGSKREHES